MNFSKMNLPDSLKEYLAEGKLSKATSVQVKSMESYQNNDSLLALAPTASGKTLAFALPLVKSLKEHEQAAGKRTELNTPYALVVTPTRELANQVSKVFKEIAHHAKFKVRFIGGNNSKVSARRSEALDILISTPQTIATMLKNKQLNLSELKYLVFDEADQVLDPGFKKEIRTIINKINFSDTHIGLFSATYPPQLQMWIDEIFKGLKLKEILIAGNLKQGDQIKTFNIKAKSSERTPILKNFLQKTLQGRGIIFCSQKNQVNDLTKFMKEHFSKLKVVHVHGDLPGADRSKNIKKFTESKAQVLIASDIAARGINILDIDWIFNYTLPRTAIYYLHRVGRLSRDGRPGTVYNLVSPKDDTIVRAINEVILREKHLAIKKLPAMDKLGKTRKKAKKQKKPKKITKRTRL